MKVKEILEILNVPEEELLTKLDNVGIVADLETDISAAVVKKLSKVYKVDIKAPKAKKQLQSQQIQLQKKRRNQLLNRRKK